MSAMYSFCGSFVECGTRLVMTSVRCFGVAYWRYVVWLSIHPSVHFSVLSQVPAEDGG